MGVIAICVHILGISKVILLVFTPFDTVRVETNSVKWSKIYKAMHYKHTVEGIKEKRAINIHNVISLKYLNY